MKGRALLIGVGPRQAGVIRDVMRRAYYAPSVQQVRNGEEGACATLAIEPDVVIIGRFVADTDADGVHAMLKDFGFEGAVGVIVEDLHGYRPDVDFVLPAGFGRRAVTRALRDQLLIPSTRRVKRAA